VSAHAVTHPTDPCADAPEGRAGVEHTYPLAPLQQGMLLDSVASDDPGTYLVQAVVALRREPVAVAALRAALARVVARHAALRAAFRWEDLDAPVQDVYRQVAMPVTVVDLRDDAVATATRPALETYLAADRRRGLDLSRAPVMRLAVVRTADDESALVWTFHHALLDGRSAS
jgi:NRPS condensation-like uncharacterized protein